MQQQLKTVDALESLALVDAPVTGPVPLDAALQLLVSGGSPKGGWEMDIAQETDPSPKGGW